MSEVLTRIREKYPAYAEIPDEKLVEAIGVNYPQYLEQDKSFADEYDKYVEGPQRTSQAESLGPSVGASSAITTPPDANAIAMPAEAEALAAEEAGVPPDKQLNPGTLQDPGARSAWSKFRESEWGHKIFGPTDLEKQVNTETGGKRGGAGIVETASKALEFTSPPPPLRTAIQATVEALNPLQVLGPKGEAVGEAVGELGSQLPIAPLGSGAVGKLAMATFTGDYVYHLPEAREAYKQALENGDAPGALKIATQTMLGGGLTAIGTTHSILPEAKVAAENNAPATATAVQQANEILKPKGGEENAISKPETTQLYGNVQQPEVAPKVTGEVPANVSGEGIPARGPTQETPGSLTGEVKGGEVTNEEMQRQVQGQEKVQEGTEVLASTEAPESTGASGINTGALGEVGMGGAKPGEFVPSRQTATGIKNAKVDEERQARGQPPIMPVNRLSNAVVWDRVMAKIDTDPGWQDRLIEDLKDKPRTPSQDEILALDHRYADLQNEYAKATRDGARAFEDNFQVGIDEAKTRAAFYESKLNELEQIARKVGTEWGRSGQMRQRLLKEDFSLAAMEARMRAAKGFEPLTESEHAEIAKLQSQIAEKEAASAVAEQKFNERVSQLEAEKSLAEERANAAKAPEYEPRVLQVAEKFAKYMDKKGEAALARLRERMGRTSTIDPTILADYGILGASKITRGIVDFAKWTDSMVRDLGERFREDAQAAWEASQKVFESDLSGFQKGADKSTAEKVRRAVTDIPGRISDLTDSIKKKSAAGEGSPLHSEVRKLVRLLVEQNPDISRDALIDRVHEILKESNPETTRIEAMDAISGRPRRKIREIPLDTAAASAKAEVMLLRDKFNAELEKQRYLQKSKAEKIWLGTKEALNLSRAILTSWDVSAVGRQGAFIALGNPLRAAKSIGPMLKALVSEKSAAAVEAEIASRPNAKLYEQSKLFLAPREGGKLTGMEEAFMSKLASKIPGVAASGRAYVTFLNKLRADSFDAMYESLTKGADATPEELKAISNYINIATGRGNLGKAAGAAETLSTAFFAPRLVASRFQLLAGEPLYRGSARTRYLVAKEYGKFLVGLGVVYSLGMMAGGTVEEDPRSSDFGKIKFGHTRIDPLAGLSQTSVLLSRLATGELKNYRGKVEPIRGNVQYGHRTAADIIATFLRSKLSPIVGNVVDVATGKNVVGEKVTPETIAQNMTIPLSFRDIYQVMDEQGIPAGTIIGLLSLFGVGVQNYDERKRK